MLLSFFLYMNIYIIKSQMYYSAISFISCSTICESLIILIALIVEGIEIFFVSNVLIISLASLTFPSLYKTKLCNKSIKFESKSIIGLKELKQFLSDFYILGPLISNEQCTYIFNKLTIDKVKRDEDGNFKSDSKDKFLDEDEFNKALMYVLIFSLRNYTDKNKDYKLSNEHLDGITSYNLWVFFDYLGLNQLTTEAQIRKKITMKKQLSIKESREIEQKLIKNKKVPEYYEKQFKSDNEIEEEEPYESEDDNNNNNEVNQSKVDANKQKLFSKD